MKAPLEAIAKADTLIEAMGWIRRFRGKTTVIKLGGSLMNNPDAMRHTLLDIIFMETVGMRPVVVHGGGPSINKAMEAAAIEPCGSRDDVTRIRRRWKSWNGFSAMKRTNTLPTK